MKHWCNIAEEHQLLGYRLFRDLHSVDMNELTKRLEIIKGLDDNDVLVDIWFSVASESCGEGGALEYDGIEPCVFSILMSELHKLNELNCPYWDAEALCQIVTRYFEDNQCCEDWAENEIDRICFISVEDMAVQIQNQIVFLQRKQGKEDINECNNVERVELLAYLQSHIPIYRASTPIMHLSKMLAPSGMRSTTTTFVVSLKNQEQEDSFLSYLAYGGDKVDSHMSNNYPKEVIWVICESGASRTHGLYSMAYLKTRVSEMFEDYVDENTICLWHNGGVPLTVIQDEMSYCFQ